MKLSDNIKERNGFVVCALAAAAAIWVICAFGVAGLGERRAVVDALNLSAVVLATIVGIVFTVLTIVLNIRAFPFRFVVPRLLASAEVSVFVFAFGITLIIDVIGMSTNIGEGYVIFSGGLFSITLVLLFNTIHFILSQLTLEFPVDELAQEFSDSLEE